MLMTKGRIFSGMQPSGRFHLGNYMGALENWVRLQHEYECFFSIVDLHALTSSYSDTSKLQENVMEMAIDWLSAGLDPEKEGIFSEDKDSPYANLIVSREDNKNDGKVKKFVQAYQSSEVESAAKQTFKGGAVKAW